MFYKIGITGPSGAGKGLVCDFLRQMGYTCIDTDKIVHRLYETDEECKAQILKFFGEGVFEDGIVSRKKLAQIVFSDKSKLEILNSIVHRFVKCRCDELCKLSFEKNETAVFIDAPQLFEAKMNESMDFCIAVLADENVRIDRIVKRDNITEEYAKKRIANQYDGTFFEENCDFVLYNNENSEVLKAQLIKVIENIGL